MLKHLVTPHSHDTADRVDRALETSEEGIRALKVSLLGLGITTVLQAFVVLATNSVALLGDTLHNLGDALTAVPLWVAFAIGRRPPNRRYTHGYGRAEDVAGIFIVLMIALSAVIAGYESIRRLLDPSEVRNLGVLIAAGIIGFVGNEAVAIYRMRVGRRIGSAALVADGLHARTDGLTSLAVVLGALGVAIGWDWADPVIGLLITGAIVLVLISAARQVSARLLDAVDPALVDRAEQVLHGVDGVQGVDNLTVRWIGHRLVLEADVAVDESLSVAEGHDIAVRAHHDLLHAVSRLYQARIHIDPVNGHDQAHAPLDHHR